MATPPGPPAASKSNDEYRLPTDVKPLHYDVTIKTDLEKLEFEGFVNISLDIRRETSSITLNATALELGKASIYSDALKVEQEQSGQTLSNAQRVTYLFPKALPAGSLAQMKIGFSGKLVGSMTGYYKSLYEVDGKKKAYALTQFEPTDARRTFPCWDEPLLKATFAITMISRADTVNLSNMPAISEEVYSPAAAKPNEHPDLAKLYSSLDNTWKITQFQTTPPMSTYIVAFANGHFAHLEKSVTMPLSGKTIPLKIYATADVVHQAQFALDVKASVLPLYEKIFDVEYPLPKLDTLVATDFDAGAMENWGLITGRTNALLLDPQKADLDAKKWVAAVQSHEVAHMWFGNITTMEWWNYLYLNEGFATLMGEVIIAGMDKVFPEWKVDSEFITNHLNRALSLDSKLSSHPIEVDCPDANHINQIFDSLSYSKAASVLRMLSNYVGEELFLKGVSIYLKKKLYANSVTKDLWEGIGAATGKDIINFMDNWITKIGFPVLTVTETPTGIAVRQDRFLETGHAEPKDNETIWNVPLSIVTVDKDGKPVLNKEAVLGAREQTFELDTSKPFKLNAGTVGVYRVLYTPERLSKIAEEASKENGIFSLNDRVGLVHDAMALSKAGLAKLSSALTLIDGLKNEKEYLVWSGISESLSGLVSIWWEHPQIVDQLNALRRALFVPLVEKLGFEYLATDSVDTSLLRTCAISQAAAAKDEGVIKELQSRFAHFMKTGDDSRIPADLQRVIFTVAVRHGGKAEFDVAINIHDNAKTPTERIAAMQALGSAEDPELLKETLKFISTKARDQDVVYFFRGLSGNPKARRLLAQYFKEEYDTLYKRFESTFTLKSLVELSMGTLSTEKDRVDIVEFFQDKDTSKYNQGLAQVLDGIRARIAYIEVSKHSDSERLLTRHSGPRVTLRRGLRLGLSCSCSCLRDIKSLNFELCLIIIAESGGELECLAVVAEIIRVLLAV
ncbi:Aminopeptidase 2, mitochondrial [Termitomyces sp. J132]|nr:Aminopeptidase 2, mitochondrial [Termitomyces sp. J132]